MCCVFRTVVSTSQGFEMFERLVFCCFVPMPWGGVSWWGLVVSHIFGNLVWSYRENPVKPQDIVLLCLGCLGHLLLLLRLAGSMWSGPFGGGYPDETRSLWSKVHFSGLGIGHDQEFYVRYDDTFSWKIGVLWGRSSMLFYVDNDHPSLSPLLRTGQSHHHLVRSRGSLSYNTWPWVCIVPFIREECCVSMRLPSSILMLLYPHLCLNLVRALFLALFISLGITVGCTSSGLSIGLTLLSLNWPQRFHPSFFDDEECWRIGDFWTSLIPLAVCSFTTLYSSFSNFYRRFCP